MTEYDLRKKARKICEKRGWRCWFAPRVKFSTAQDIFNAFDMLVLFQNNEVGFIQITTRDHLANRHKKIAAIFADSGFPRFCSIWAYDKQKKLFIEKYLNKSNG